LASEKLSNTLSLIPRDSRVAALVVLVPNAVFAITIKALPSEHRIYGFIVFACVLIATLISTWVAVRRSTSQDHDQPNFALKVGKLKDKLYEDGFLPQLIIAIPRSGLAVAGGLANRLGDKKIVPVISLSPSKDLGFNNSFNHLDFKRRDFDTDPAEPINILIVDDICRSGRTLDEAKKYVEGAIAPGDFVIKTAAISFYKGGHARAIPPSFFFDRPVEAVRSTAGEVEPLQD